MAAYRERQTSGKLPILVSHYSSGGLPDAVAVLDFYVGAKARDYWGDAEMVRLMEAGSIEMDPATRDGIYRKAFDRMNEMSFVLPIATHPAVAHSLARCHHAYNFKLVLRSGIQQYKMAEIESPKRAGAGGNENFREERLLRTTGAASPRPTCFCGSQVGARALS